LAFQPLGQGILTDIAKVSNWRKIFELWYYILCGIYEA